MFTEPVPFFEEVANRLMNLTIPVVTLLLTGALLGLYSYRTIPDMQSNTGLQPNLIQLERDILLTRFEAVFYPFWIVVFWLLFVAAFYFFISWVNGLADFKGLFNCTSFLIYPHFLVSIIILAIEYLMPSLGIVSIILQFVVGIITLYLLIEIARGAGKLSMMNAVFAATTPAFFFLLLWLAYKNIIGLFISS